MDQKVLVPYADLAIEVKITTTMLSNEKVTELRKSVVDSLKLLTPDFKGGTVESNVSLKLQNSGLVLVVQRFVYEAFIDGDRLQDNIVAG